MANQNITINPQDLLPRYWHGVYLASEADLIFIGSKNIEYLKQHWRSEERSLAKQVVKAQADIELLAGKTVEDIRAMAAKYENPDFPHIGLLEDSWNDDLEPLDAASINRKSGATTFNVCGWCEHCGGGTCRRNCHITTYCPLIPRQFGNGETWGNNKQFRFNTPCALANGTQELLDTCVEYLKSRKAQLIARKHHAASCASYLARVMGKAESKPCFAEYRSGDWFNLDDRVMAFVSDFEGVLPDKVKTFIPGRVINGYRHHEGCVSVCLDEEFHAGDYCGGRGGGYGASRPEVLHEWEFEYFKSHPDYLKVWVRCAKAGFSGFDSEAFVAAITKA